MIRTRMLWFSFGFASASAAIAHFIRKDIWFDRNSIASEMKEKFKSLDGRVSNLESVLSSETNAPRTSQFTPGSGFGSGNLFSQASSSKDDGTKEPNNVIILDHLRDRISDEETVG